MLPTLYANSRVEIKFFANGIRPLALSVRVRIRTLWRLESQRETAISQLLVRIALMRAHSNHANALQSFTAD